jgi:photosystem II stability/assembly factor-like uncharacterized protein
VTSSTNRVMYIGTTEDLYRVELNGVAGEPQALGLRGKGGMRGPAVVDHLDQRRIYAGTGQAGVFRSDDEGRTWREANQGIIYKEIWWMEQHPSTGDIYAGTGPASVFRSSDGGDTWIDLPHLRDLPETRDWTFPRPPHIAHVKGLALTPSDRDRIFCAVEEGWILRSTDGGQSWQDIKAGTEFDSHSVAIMPDNPQTVISTSGTGIYKSIDGGDTFHDANTGMRERYMTQIVVHPARPNVLFTAAAAVPPPGWRRPEGAAAGFYRSEDQGDSWERLNGGLPEHFVAAPRVVAGDPEDPETFFAGMTDGSIWTTRNGGDSFETLLTGLPHVTSLRVVPR